MIKFNCPHCGNPMKVPESAAGKRGACKKCGQSVSVPNSEVITESGQPVLVRPKNTEVVPPQPEPPQQVVIMGQQPAQPFIDTRPPVTVNVKQEKRHSNSLGIGSIILGFMAFMFCWIPIANILSFVFGGIGMLMAIIGFFVGMGRKGSGVGYPIVGGLFCGISLFVIVSMYFTIFAVATGASAVATETEKQNNIQRNNQLRPQVRSQRSSRLLSPNASQNEQKRLLEKEKNTKKEMNTEPEPVKPLPLGNIATAGDVTVEILETTIDNNKLNVRLLIKNNNQSKKHTYSQWQSKYFRTGDMLVDNLGRSYKTVSGNDNTRKLLPGKSIENILVFESPSENAKTFMMTLYPRTFTKRRPLNFKFGIGTFGTKSSQPSNKATKNHQLNRKITDKAEYTIINDETFLDYKRSIDVRLSKKITEDQIKSIAQKIKAMHTKKYKQVFICYYLPRMKVDSGAWAISHFRPDLKIEIMDYMAPEKD